MALVNKIDKRIKMSKDEVIKYQILTHCFLNDIQISVSDLNCLHLLALEETIELTKFCEKVSEMGVLNLHSHAEMLYQKQKKRFVN